MDVPTSAPINFNEVLDSFETKMNNFELQAGASIAIQGFRDLNGYLTEEAPWLKKGDEFTQFRQSVVRTTLESIYILAHLLTPFIPEGSAKIFRKLNTEPTTLAELNREGHNLAVGTRVDIGDVLYSKILSEEELTKEEEKQKKAESYAEAQKRKKEKKAQLAAASQKGQAAASDQPEFTKIDIRVGEITKVWNHPEADKLFCEEIDVGEATGPRQIASGLREHYSLQEMQGKKVLVVCNLKSSKIVGFASNGMVLAAKGPNGSKVELVEPPADAPVGERVFIEGLSGEPLSAAQVKKRKAWDSVAEGLKTGEGGVATWDGKTIMTSTGPCSASSLVGVPIS
jgi:methionine--tRNA ligase beta chain